MLPDWVDNYIDNEGNDDKNKAFSFTKPESLDLELKDIFRNLFKELIRKCSNREKGVFTYENFKKLKIIVINECCFDAISRWIEPRNNSAKYEYVILIPYSIVRQEENFIKHKIAHEFAHFFFSLQGIDVEEKECNRKAAEWNPKRNDKMNKNN